MPPAVLFLKNRLAAADLRQAAQAALLVILNGAALGLLLWSEDDLEAQTAFALSWGLLNGFWLLLLRRPLTRLPMRRSIGIMPRCAGCWPLMRT